MPHNRLPIMQAIDWAHPPKKPRRRADPNPTCPRQAETPSRKLTVLPVMSGHSWRNAGMADHRPAPLQPATPVAPGQNKESAIQGRRAGARCPDVLLQRSPLAHRHCWRAAATLVKAAASPAGRLPNDAGRRASAEEPQVAAAACRCHGGGAARHWCAST